MRRKWVAMGLAVLMCLCVAGGMAEIVHEGEAVLLVRDMMALPYRSMTVAEFNLAIQRLCADAGTDVFAVISDVYDHYYTCDDAGEFVGFVFSDRELEVFMETTLAYAAQEIFGEPVLLGSVMYVTLPGMTAVEVYEERERMAADEWAAFFEAHIEEIAVFPVLSYAIEEEIADEKALLVVERDRRMNGARDAIVSALLGLSEEEAAAEALWDVLEEAFERISAAFSDGEMTVVCRIQGLERDM